MRGDSSSFEWLRAEIRSAAREFAEALRQTESDASVPGLEWTVGELGAHVASIPGFYLGMIDGEPFVLPDDLAAIAFNNRELIEAVGTTDPFELADLVVSEFDRFLDRLGDDGDALVNWFVTRYPARCMAGAALGELLVHRADLLSVAGTRSKITGDQARAVLSGAIPVSEHYVNTDVARRASGTYHLHVRGGDDWTLRVSADGSALVEPGKPARADLRQSADPVALLALAYGRMSPLRAGLTGKVVAWGRKPWLAWRSRNLFHVI